MEREETTLIVFSLAFVLVLAGFAVNEKAYAGENIIPLRDELHCWGIITDEDVPDDPRIQMILQDQFGEEPHELIDILEFCNPTNKTTFNINFKNTTIVNQQHWSVYEINTTTDDPVVIATVLIEDQFHPGGFEADVLNLADILMVPTQKAEDKPEGKFFDTFTDLHFKCYSLINAEIIEEEFTLTDQFAETNYTDLTPIEICTPVIKFLEEEPGSGDFNIIVGDVTLISPVHYLCYDIPPDVNPDIDFFFNDQFLEEVGATTIRDEVLCTVATKIIIGPVVGGINIPIDTSSLLLAGVQSISMWMIPVVIAGVGIGIFVIKRRK